MHMHPFSSTVFRVSCIEPSILAVYVHLADSPAHRCTTSSTAAGNMGIRYFFVCVCTIFTRTRIIHSLSDARQLCVILRKTVFIAAAYPTPLGC